VVTNYAGAGIDDPIMITAGSDGALWFTNADNNSIGRITTAGVVTNYTGAGINFPQGITAGPDGALWFTNESNGSIGRITTAGVLSFYTDPSISYPIMITTGPDGALWFTNFGNRFHRAYHHHWCGLSVQEGPEGLPHHRQPRGDHLRSRWGPVVHRPR